MLASQIAHDGADRRKAGAEECELALELRRLLDGALTRSSFGELALDLLRNAFGVAHVSCRLPGVGHDDSTVRCGDRHDRGAPRVIDARSAMFARMTAASPTPIR